MKKLILSLSAIVFATALTASAEELTLSGKATCAKCDLKTADKCTDVLQVTKDGKTTTYMLTVDKDKAFHKQICSEAKNATVTGTVSEKDGKKFIAVSKFEAKK